MKKSRFTDTQIVSILKEVDAGRKVDEVCRQYGISNATYYNWKSKYGGITCNQSAGERQAIQQKAVHGTGVPLQKATPMLGIVGKIMMQHKIFTMPFAKVYPLYVQKAERKNRTKAEVDQLICWLTGYDQAGLA